MHASRDRTSRRHRGFLLITGLLVTSGLILLATGSLMRTQVEWTAASRFLAQQQALYLAEGRMEQVVAAFALSPSLAQGTTCPFGVDAAVGTTSCTLTPLQLYVNGPGGLTTQPAQIVVTATVPNAVTPLGRQILEAVVEVPGPSLFQVGYYSAYGMWVGRFALVDSYNSSLGPYGGPSLSALNATIQVGNSCPGSGCQGLLLNGAQVYGDALAAPGSFFTTLGTARIYGVRGTAPARTMPAVRIPLGSPLGSPLESCPGGTATVDVTTLPYSAITLSGPCNITLTGSGVLSLNDLYLPEGSLTINGNVEVTTPRFYMGGNVLLGSNASAAVYADDTSIWGEVNGTGSQGKPKDFALYATENASWVIVDNRFYGTIYAPTEEPWVIVEGALSGTGAQVFGSVIVNGVPWIMDRGQIHQDLSLKTLAPPVGPSNPIRLKSWRTL